SKRAGNSRPSAPGGDRAGRGRRRRSERRANAAVPSPRRTAGRRAGTPSGAAGSACCSGVQRAPAALIYYPPLFVGFATLPHSPEEKRKVLARIRRIRGQCEGLERALESGVDCGPVLQQIAAIRGAVNGLMSEVLE